MNRMIAFILLVMTACLAGCTAKGEKQADGTVKVRFGEIGVSERAIPIYLGLKKGFFREQGIDLEITRFNGGPDMMTAAAAGEVDAGSIGTPVILAAAKGVPVRVVGSPVAPGNPFVLVGRNPYRTVAELKGRKIGAGNVGGGSRQAFIAIVRAKGFTFADFQTLDAGGTANAFAALQAGQLDGAITSEFSAAKAELAGFGTVVARAVDCFGHYQHSFFFATRKFIEANPEKVRGFLEAYRKSIRYAKAHPEEAIALGTGELQLEEKPLRLVLGKGIPAWDERFTVDMEGTNNAIRALKELGDLDAGSPIRAEQLVDARFAK
ncbi:MAG TPA: ABC transporter substrate-binding protein [Desulfuromonadaceae bacterium]